MKTNDIASLPKWAQQKIGVLERNLADAERQLTEGAKLLEYGEPGVGYGSGMQRRAIPSNNISYVTKKGVHFNLGLNDGEQLVVNVGGYSGGHPVVFPKSSNHMHIGICPCSK